jgi:hypothetical protein
MTLYFNSIESIANSKVTVFHGNPITVITGPRQAGKTRTLVQNMYTHYRNRDAHEVYILTRDLDNEEVFTQKLAEYTLNNFKYNTVGDYLADSSRKGENATVVWLGTDEDFDKLILAAKNASEVNKIRVYIDDCPIEIFDQIKKLGNQFLQFVVVTDCAFTAIDLSKHDL